MDNVLIVFLKYPEPGKVKTRLAKDMGHEKACLLYKVLAENVIKNVFPKNQSAYDVHIFFTPADKKKEIRAWVDPLTGCTPGGGAHYIPQEGANLGERMHNAFQHVFRILPCNAIVIGTDCPGIDAPLIEHAFELLREKDIVIGPCRDGGYYLLGMSKPAPDLFADISWSTNRVFVQTMERVQTNKLSCAMLRTLTDIDTKEDLSAFVGHPFDGSVHPLR